MHTKMYALFMWIFLVVSFEAVGLMFPCRLLYDLNNSWKESVDTVDYYDYACKNYVIMIHVFLHFKLLWGEKLKHKMWKYVE